MNVEQIIKENQILKQRLINVIRENKYIINEVVRNFSKIKVEAKKIVFVNFNGKGYGCNPKYIAEEIIRQKLNYDLVWLVNDVNSPMPKQIRKVIFNSIESFYELATAKVIITNVKNRLPFIKKNTQYLIMTWHAPFGFKYVEKDVELQLDPYYVAESKENSKITDLMIAATAEQLEEMHRAYWYDGKILKCGLPRNDIFFNHTNEFVLNIKKSLNLSTDKKIILYAPTFRTNQSFEVYKFNHQKLLVTLNKKFGNDWILLLRLHPNITTNLFQSSENIIDVTKYPDVQELIVISDILISDYSSIIFDFMISNKLIFLYVKDYDSFPRERNLKQIYYELPFKPNRTEEELFDDILNCDESSLRDKIKKYLSKIKSFDDGNASQKITNEIKSVVEGEK